MTGLQLAALAGLLLAAGTVGAVWWLVPRRPALTPALERLAADPGPLVADQQGPVLEAEDRVGGWLYRRVPERVWMTPVRELALLRRTPAHFAGEKLLAGGLGLIAPPLLAFLLSALGLRFPVAVPAVVSLAAAVGLFFLPNIDIRARAKAARLEFNHVLSCFVDLVALERRAGSGPRQALEAAARTGRGHWVFDRIGEELTQSSVDGRPPWDGLRRMAADLALPELDDLANIMALAEQQTMPVYQTLRDHNQALRVMLITDEQARANAANERLTVPAVLLAMVFIVILTAAPLMTLLAS